MITDREVRALERQLSIPSPRNNYERSSRASYSLFYRMDDSDSPNASRGSLTQRVLDHIGNLSAGGVVVDLGAGKQILEREYHEPLRLALKRSSSHLITMDLADLTQKDLLDPSFTHLQATGVRLPFRDHSVSGVISNMAFDFMPREAISELHRILKPGGFAVLNLHHPYLLSPDLDSEHNTLFIKLARKAGFGKKITPNDEMRLSVKRQHIYLRDNKLLYESPDQIRGVFESAGFIIPRVTTGEEIALGKDIWWEVDMVAIPLQETIREGGVK